MCQLRLTLEKSIPWKQYTFHVYNTRNAHAQGGVNDALIRSRLPIMPSRWLYSIMVIATVLARQSVN